MEQCGRQCANGRSYDFLPQKAKHKNKCKSTLLTFSDEPYDLTYPRDEPVELSEFEKSSQQEPLIIPHEQPADMADIVNNLRDEPILLAEVAPRCSSRQPVDLMNNAGLELADMSEWSTILERSLSMWPKSELVDIGEIINSVREEPFDLMEGVNNTREDGVLSEFARIPLEPINSSRGQPGDIADIVVRNLGEEFAPRELSVHLTEVAKDLQAQPVDLANDPRGEPTDLIEWSLMLERSLSMWPQSELIDIVEIISSIGDELLDLAKVVNNPGNEPAELPEFVKNPEEEPLNIPYDQSAEMLEFIDNLREHAFLVEVIGAYMKNTMDTADTVNDPHFVHLAENISNSGEVADDLTSVKIPQAKLVKLGEIDRVPGEASRSDLQARAEFIYENGAKYIGEWMGNQRHGQGTQVWPDGGKYVGQWRNDMAEGQGRFEHADGDVYDGSWKNDKAHGQGTYTHVDGCRYDGDWRENKQHGEGIEIWPDGARYEGEYLYGCKSGRGRFVWADGAAYVGQFIDNAVSGEGVFNSSGSWRWLGSENQMPPSISCCTSES